jgi:hypothetical protein
MIGLSQDGYLCLIARDHKRFPGSPVGIGGTATNQGMNGIAISQSLTKWLENEHTDSLTTNVTIGIGIAKFTVPIGGEHTSSRKSECKLWLQDQVRPANESLTTFTNVQTLASKMESG